MIKVIGQTGNGRCGCGHRVKAGEEYFIVSSAGKNTSKCSRCIKSEPFVTIRVPQDLVNRLIVI